MAVREPSDTVGVHASVVRQYQMTLIKMQDFRKNKSKKYSFYGIDHLSKRIIHQALLQNRGIDLDKAILCTL